MSLRCQPGPARTAVTRALAATIRQFHGLHYGEAAAGQAPGPRPEPDPELETEDRHVAGAHLGQVNGSSNVTARSRHQAAALPLLLFSGRARRGFI